MELMKLSSNFFAHLALGLAVLGALVGWGAALSANSAKQEASEKSERSQRELKERTDQLLAKSEEVKVLTKDNAKLLQEQTLTMTGGDGHPTLGIFSLHDRFILFFVNDTKYPIYINKIEVNEPAQPPPVDERTNKRITDLPKGTREIHCGTLAPKQRKELMQDMKPNAELNDYDLIFKVQTFQHVFRYFVHFRKIQTGESAGFWDWAHSTLDENGKRLGPIMGNESLLSYHQKGMP